MQTDIGLLLITAIVIACLHTVSGPDHYIPFVALSKARGWSLGSTIGWTILCGCGHVWSSVLLGLGGAALGWSLSSINGLEALRGGVAGWALLLFGFGYALWGLYRTRQNRRHKHFDVYNDGSVYVYEHRHGEAVAPKDRRAVTPWVMFLIFVLGPCEPMIPLLYMPAAQWEWWNLWMLIGVYTVFTLLTMLAMVTALYYGVSFLKTERWEKHVHLMSGVTIFVCGAGMVFMGW